MIFNLYTFLLSNISKGCQYYLKDIEISIKHLFFLALRRRYDFSSKGFCYLSAQVSKVHDDDQLSYIKRH